VEAGAVTTRRPGDVVEVFVREVDWKRGVQPGWVRAVFEEIMPSGFFRVKMIDGSMRVFAVEDVRPVEPLGRRSP